MSLSEPTFAYIIASEDEDAPVAILAELPNGDQIWSGEISSALFNEQDQETQDQLGSDSGDFIVHADRGEVRVLARAANAEAAMILTEAYARLLATRQEGSAEDAGAAMRHTLSVQATDKSDRAEGVAALQQAASHQRTGLGCMTDLKPEDLERVERLLARAIVAANSSAPVETHLGLACEFIGAREDFLSLLADRARMEKAIEDLTADRDAWKADAKHYMVAMGRADAERDEDAARAEGVATESKPTEMGGFVGDIFYGDPVHTTRGTHRWTGTEWRRLPSEVETLTELLAEARARVAALQQAGEPISRENLEAELRETIGLYVREAVTRMFSEENATYRCARQIAGMLQPGYYLHRKLFSSPLPQQTALVEEGVEKIIAQHEPAACGASAPSEPPRSAGQRLCESFAATFEGGGWADAPEWENFDEHQHKRWERAAEHFLGISDGGEG